MEHIKKHLFFLLICLSYFVDPSKLHQLNSRKHFVLVHGAGHGAWCWYKLIPLLKSSGHKVTALDLAASGINSKQVLDVPSLSDYTAPLMDFMASLPPNERVILVSHSYSGFPISQAMEKFPKRVSVGVFITSFMPGPRTNYSTFIREETRSLGDTMDTRYGYEYGPNNPPTYYTLGPKFMAKNLYQLSPIQDLTLARLLVRPLHVYGTDDVSRTLRLSNENYGSVSRVFILIDQDKALKKDFQLWMIKENPPNEVREITDSDHMVMLSKPKELFVQLLDISQKYS